RADLSDWRKIEGLLAGIFRRPYLSLHLRDIDPRARDHARAGLQRLHRRCDLLRSVRLSKAPRPHVLVPWRLDLLRARVPDQDFARAGLSARDFYFALCFPSG